MPFRAKGVPEGHPSSTSVTRHGRAGWRPAREGAEGVAQDGPLKTVIPRPMLREPRAARGRRCRRYFALVPPLARCRAQRFLAASESF